MAQEDQMGWQRQNMKKTGAQTLSVGSMHPKLGGCDCSIPKFADGTDGAVDVAALKAEGLAASSGESVGFLKRLSMGNIDDPSSEAYQEFGAGRGQRMRNAQAASDESAAIAKYERDSAAASARQTADTAIANKKQDMGEFEGVDEAIERNKTAPAPAKTKPAAPAKAAAPAAPARDPRDAETGQGRGSRSFSADVAERKAKAAPSASSDTSFDPVKLNFANSKPAVKPAAQEDKNKARPISRSRAYYSGSN